MSNPLNVEFSLQYGIYFYKWNLTFHSSNIDPVGTVPVTTFVNKNSQKYFKNIKKLLQ